MKQRTTVKSLAAFLVLLLAVSLLFTACNTDTPVSDETSTDAATSETTDNSDTSSEIAEETTGGGTFTIAVNSECSNVAAWRLRSGQESVSWGPIYETLFKVAGEGEVEGYLAESLDSNYDDLTYTVTLRQDVYFSDGSQLDADVLLWNFENFKENSQYSTTDFGNVDYFEKTGDFTVVIHLSQWTSQMPYSLARNAGLMYSKKAFDENGYDWCLQNPVGTGPYLLDEWVNDEYKTYVRNENYWNTDAAPYFDNLKVVIIADEAAAQNALMGDEIDACHGLSNTSQAAMMNMGGYERFTNKLNYNSYIMVFASDVEDSPLSDVRVRKAICYAIDSETISETLGFGLTLANNQYGIPGTKFYNDDIEGYSYDPDKAIELLEEAGYADGFSTTLYTGNDMDMTSWMVAVQGYLQDVGINMRIEILDTSEWVGTYLYDIPEGMIFGPRHSFGSNIVNQVLSNFSHNAIDGVGMLNKCKLHPDDLDEALQNAVSASDEEEMIASFKEACKLLIDEYCLAYPLANSNSSVVISKDNIVDNGCFDRISDFPDYNLIYREE